MKQDKKREKIKSILHPDKPCHKDYPCPIPNWGECRYCNEQIDQLLALFPDEEEIRRRERIFPKGYYPAHIKKWAEEIKQEQGYESSLSSFLRQLGENWQALKEKP